jgi:hypothetical protein
MNFLPVTSDVQTLELTYALHPKLSEQPLSFGDCTDVSLGLIETNGLKAVLSAHAGFVRLEHATITLRKIELETLEEEKRLARLEPLQHMNLRFEKQRAVIDDMPLTLSEEIPYYLLIQHLVIGRLEYILTEMDIFHLDIYEEAVKEKFAELLRLRGYEEARGLYSKYLLITNTTNVVP